MAVGDAARSAGYSVVPDTGEEGRVRWGAREINRTRDYIANLKRQQESQGQRISYGTSNPSGGSNGDIYLQVTS